MKGKPRNKEMLSCRCFLLFGRFLTKLSAKLSMNMFIVEVFFFLSTHQVHVLVLFVPELSERPWRSVRSVQGRA